MKKNDDAVVTYPAPMDSVENLDQRSQGNFKLIHLLFPYRLRFVITSIFRYTF